MTTFAPVIRAPRGRPLLPRGASGLKSMDEDQLACLAVQLAGTPVPGVRMTEREFVDWSLYRVNAEWVDGEVILVPPGNEEHEGLDEWLGRLLDEFVEVRRLGVLRRNMFVRLPRQRRRRVPDLFFIAEANRARIRATFIDGPPDLVVEIVSPDSQNRDRRDKYAEYQAAGAREYWLIDPLSQTFDAYSLRGRKFKRIAPVEGRVESAVLPGFHLRLTWLFGRHRPRVAQALKGLGTRG